MTIRFKKLRDGDWGLIGPADQLHAGETVSVTTKAGATKSVRISHVTKPFGAGLRIAHIEQHRRRASLPPVLCPSCCEGYTDERGYCGECGERSYYYA